MTVEKVGRLWITTANERFHVENLTSEHSDHRRLYLSEAEQVAEHEFRTAWSAFRQRVGGLSSWRPPDGLTPDTLRQVEALLWPAAAAPREDRG